MASINYAAREINVKIVYYGPGLSGKTTNLQVIHRKVPPEFKSDMVSLATETDRTLFFDFLPLDLGKIKGFSTKFQLYTVPGQVYYNATRKLVLRGVDGIVFVADSGQDKIEENLESFQNLEENLSEYGYKRENIPTIIQYNKRDLPNALSIEEMHQHINKYNLPWSEAVANKGVGVFDSLKLIGKIVIDYLNKKYSRGGSGGALGQRSATAPAASQPQRPAPPPARPLPPQQQDFQMGSGGQQQYSAPSQRIVPPQQQSMFNQLGQQPPVRPQFQQNPAQAQPQQRPMYAPQQPRQPIAPPPQFPTGRTPGLRPQQQQQQRPAQQQNYQPTSDGFQQSQPFPAMEQQPRPIAQQSMRQPAPPAIEPNYQDDIAFEPGTMQPPPEQHNKQEDFYNYGSINLERMDQHPETLQQPEAPYNPYTQPSAPSDSADFNVSGKTDLDLEIERYQREIEEKQRRTRGTGTQPMPQQNQPMPSTGQPPQQFSAGQQQADYEVYNMETPAYETQQQQQGAPAIVPNNDDEEMYFTSVDKDRQKKPIKRPLNPRIAMQPPQQDKGFLSKFFKKDTP